MNIYAQGCNPSVWMQMELVFKVYNMMMTLYTYNEIIATVKLINNLIVTVITERGRVKTWNEQSFGTLLKFRWCKFKLDCHTLRC